LFPNLLELLPVVPLTHYRITAKVRFERALGENCQWGVYCRYDQEPSTQGIQRYFHALIISEEMPLSRTLKLGDEYWSYQAHLAPRLFREFISRAEDDLRASRWIQVNEQNFVHRKHPVKRQADLWRTLVIEVSPESTVASCTDSAGHFTLTPIPRESEAAFLTHLRTKYDDLAALPSFPRPGSAVGIFLRQSVCTIDRFQIEPMTPPADGHNKEQAQWLRQL
jgi:hypothetical protein